MSAIKTVSAQNGDWIDVTNVPAGVRITVHTHTCTSIFFDPSDAQAIADAVLAVAHESEAAVLQARRDELTAELTGIDGERYNSIGVGTILRKSIDRIIELEAQVSS